MASTIHLDRDIDALFEARQKLVRAGRECKALTCQYLIRPVRPEQDPGLLFLPICPKRYIKRSHERHKLQRWIKEALRISPLLANVEHLLKEKQLEVLLGIRIDRMPSPIVHWKSISADMQVLLEQLLLVIERYTIQ